MKKTTFFILLMTVLLMILPMTALATTATVKYIDENGVEQSHECIIMTGQENYSFESNQWYAVTGDVTIQNRIENNADASRPAYLILADGARLNAPGGIHNPNGKELIICGQKNNSGELDIEKPQGFASGIGGNRTENGGTLTINGGKLVITGGASASGIGGGMLGNGGLIIMNGGEVHANGGSMAAGIGGGGGGGDCGYITINGGTVYANGGERGAGIGNGMGSTLSNGFVNINGGTVTAKGGLTAAGIGGGNLSKGVNVTINGGTVSATGGDRMGEYEAGPGIGGTGYHKTTGELSLKEGVVIYAGNSYADATAITVSEYKETRSKYALIDKAIPYEVRHCTQTTDGYGYELKESENLYGIALLNTDAKAKEYDGFTSLDITQKSIAADGTTVVTVKYDRLSYFVRFVSDICPGPDPISARYGSEVKIDVGSLSAAGYNFNGWYEDEARTEKFDMPQTVIMPFRDITLYAGWIANPGTPYTVKYYDMNIDGTGYVLRETLPMNGYAGRDTAAEAPDRDGFTVKPFNQKKIANNGSTLVEIHYDRNQYTVTFDANGHGNAPEAITAYYEQPVSAPQSPKQDGEYVFSGWFEDQDCTRPYTFSVMPLNGKTVYAGWTRKWNIAVSFNTICGTYVDTQVINIGEKATKPATDPTRNGYTFDGWYTDSTYGTMFDFSKAINANTVICAKWTKNASAQYTVTWKLDDTQVIDTTTVNAGEMPVHDDPAKTGYIFTGWDPALAPVTGDITYTAKFVQLPHEHTYSTDWSSDETNHWHAATCEHTEIAKGIAPHQFGDDNVCDVCQYVKKSPVPVDLPLYGIVITTPPKKITYTEGESFNPTGMVVNALYAKPITNYSLSPFSNLIRTDTAITVSYTENGVTKTAQQPITVGPVKEPYKIIAGANQVVLTTANSAVFSSNADFSKFVRVEVDGKEVASKYYIARSGSTVITFGKDYIATLKEGKHTLRIVSTDGSASTGFTVSGPLPPTGDSTHPALLLTLLIASMVTLLLMAARTRKRNQD